MKRLLLGAGLLLTAVAWGVGPGASAGDRKGEIKNGEDKKRGEKGWVQLFNGKNLDGWKSHPKSPGKWRVEGGMIVSGGKDVSHLFSERGDYENFHYRIEAKINDKGNSGQYFRTKFAPGYPPGYEAQINSNFPPDPQRTGSLYNLARITEMLVPPDTWFTQEVIANGNHIIIKVNGKKVVDYVDKRGPKKRFTRGHFALQQHGAWKDPKTNKVYETVLHVRKVEVKELPTTKGEKEPEKNTGAVSGRVTYKGKPLTGGVVTFTSGKQVVTGALDEEGRYEVTNVPVGTVKVSVSTESVRPKKAPGGDKIRPKGELKKIEDPDKGGRRFVVIPQRYSNPETSGLTLEVRPGRQQFNIELQ
jgi:hypothetical protein